MNVMQLDDYKQKYSAIDQVYYFDDLQTYVKSRKEKIQTVHLNGGYNEHSGLKTLIPGGEIDLRNLYELFNVKVDRNLIHKSLIEARSVKT